MSEGKIRFSLSGKAEWLLPLVLASSHLSTDPTGAHTRHLACRVVFAVFLLLRSNVKGHLTAYELLTLQVPRPCCEAACCLGGCTGGWPCVLSVAREFWEPAFLFHVCPFLSLRFWHKPLRKIVGLGNNLKPPNLLSLKVPLSSETNSLSWDLV